MDKLINKLTEVKELCKMLKPGTVAGGRNMPTLKVPEAPGPKIKSGTGVQKLPGLTPSSKVNPVKSAEQVQNKDVKDIRMKEAQQALKINPMNKSEHLSFNSFGQWSLQES